MQEASLVGVLRVVLIILLIYFGLKILIRWFGPIILRYFLKKIGKKFGAQFQNFDPGKQSKREGEVSIDKKPSKKPNKGKDVGEYIDYEEID